MIEIIEIRAPHKSRKILEAELQNILAEIEKESRDYHVRIYTRINLETDFVILIMNESDNVNGHSDELGVRLGEGLKTYGMVYRSKWQELEPLATHNESVK